MPNTLVIQSHRHPLPFPWLDDCLTSVQEWSDVNGFDYKFLGDELFEPLAQDLIHKTHHQVVITTDLARLLQLQYFLNQDYDIVIWCDADFLIFNPENFLLPNENFALGREVWIQRDKNNQLRSYRKVHNAFMMFRRGNHFLDFYCDSAERLLRQNQGRVPPQFIGPKLLTALHNIVQCPVMETAGMFSPLVLQDIARGYGEALSLMQKKSSANLAGANICGSMVGHGGLTNSLVQRVITRLLSAKRIQKH